MKFGKRLAQEAGRRWSSSYIEYKSLKKAIKDDVVAADVKGGNFARVLASELQKVSQFYVDKSAQLEAHLSKVATGLEPLAQLRSEVKELIKYVALNYLAVVKAIKKRNKNMKERFGASSSPSLHALDLLAGEVFFTSPRLSDLATKIEVVAAQQSQNSTPAAALEEFSCPICLDTLHNPVVLTCAHRFCWGCLVAFCTTLGTTTPVQVAQSKAFEGASKLKSLSQVLEQIASDDQQQEKKFFCCPVCRQPQVLDVDRLSIDGFLANYIQGLKAISTMSVDEQQQVALVEQQQQQHAGSASACMHRHAPGCCAAPAAQPPAEQPWGIIPPQAAEHKGKLTVLLDLDGTLVASFTPRRAPRLPPSVRTHVVGVGSQLNPAGVFVVERPGLREFLQELSSFAEVIIYTAGLEDYAKPIIDAIDPHDEFFVGRIYREGTLRTEYYQCVKDMARLNRDLKRTILVDDTPLAFLHQPENGVPVLGFRGDPDDRLLMEAVLPLCQVLKADPDVRATLQRRFDMCTWFRRNSFPIDAILQAATESVEAERRAAAAAAAAPSTPEQRPYQLMLQQQPSEASQLLDHQQQAMDCAPCGCAASAPAPSSASALAQQACGMERFARFYAAQPRAAAPSKRWLLLADFDQTLTTFDCGERVSEALAPELLPMLVGIESTQSFIPMTNQILSEMQRRGVSRDALLQTLHALGAEGLPPASLDLLRSAAACGVDVKILSDANSTFISHMLAGARASAYVQEVITNAASFERVGAGAEAALATLTGGAGPSTSAVSVAAMVAAGPSSAYAQAQAASAGLSAPSSSISSSSSDATAEGASGACSPFSSAPTSPALSLASSPAGPSFLQLSRSAPSLHAGACGSHRGGAGACSAAAGPSSSSQQGYGHCMMRADGSSATAAARHVSSTVTTLGHKLVIRPRHGSDQSPHACPHCPPNMCKGLEVARIRHANAYERIVYAGDGANDVCAALSLGPADVLLARAGYPLAQFCQASAAAADAAAAPGGTAGAALPRVAASVAYWSSHDELLALAGATLQGPSSSSSA